MAWFWPWRGDPSSPASFEKMLSALSDKITKTQAHLDSLRSRRRRIRGLATFYLILAYLVYGIVAILVIGQQNMGPLEWTLLAGSPVIIYTTRQLVAAFFNWRIESATAKLEAQQEERAKTIQKLKDATKYNSTVELIEKYSGEPKNERQDDEGNSRPPSRQSLVGPHQQRPQGRTGIAPPPTANIRRGDNRPTTPNLEPTAEFAPNADFSPSQSAQGSMRGLPPGMNAMGMGMLHPDMGSMGGGATGGDGGIPNMSQMHPGAQRAQYESANNGPHWYDRFLDMLLGDDEMSPKNRIVLICSRCRLVNGQAPPGTKTLGDVGMWKCMGCGNMNGEVDDGKKLLRELMIQGKKKQQQQQQQQQKGNDEKNGRGRGVKKEEDVSMSAEIMMAEGEIESSSDLSTDQEEEDGERERERKDERQSQEKNKKKKKKGGK